MVIGVLGARAVGAPRQEEQDQHADEADHHPEQERAHQEPRPQDPYCGPEGIPDDRAEGDEERGQEPHGEPAPDDFEIHRPDGGAVQHADRDAKQEG